MHGLERASIQEIRAIDAEVRRRLGPEVRTSPSYIANILSEAGTHVEFAGRSGPFVDPPMEEPYATRLKGVLQFHDLESGEAAIRMLDALRREYQHASDRAGVELVRSEAHPWVKQRAAITPPTVQAQYVGLNGRIAASITKAVGTMWAFSA